MSLVTIGLSHHRAPLSLLEAVALDDAGRDALATAVLAGENVSEVVVVSTCNRTEVYAVAVTFHGAVAEITDALCATTGVAREVLRDHLYIHYEDRAIAHAFSVACGLDSMAVGESQILGQMRSALRRGQKLGHVGTGLNALFQRALRVGKRAHTETGIDAVSVSLVEAAVARAEQHLGVLDQLSVLLVGAGGMSGLAASTVARRGARELVIVNRTLAKAQSLAERTGGRARPLAQLPAALADADVVISCTGSVGTIVDLTTAADAQVARGGRHQAYLDLALPHDVAPEVASLTGVSMASLEALGGDLSDGASSPPVREVADLVVSEVAAFLTARAADAVAPTVAALRGRAAEVVERELSRLDQRVPALDEASRHEVRLTVHRIVEKLLHTPTVRIKELAVGAQGGDYTQALRELFDLDPRDTAVVSVPPPSPEALP